MPWHRLLPKRGYSLSRAVGLLLCRVTGLEATRNPEPCRAELPRSGFLWASRTPVCLKRQVPWVMPLQQNDTPTRDCHQSPEPSVARLPPGTYRKRAVLQLSPGLGSARPQPLHPGHGHRPVPEQLGRWPLTPATHSCHTGRSRSGAS